MNFDLALLSSVLRAVTPILFAALAGALCQRAGVFNISLEGTMLVGCFAAVAGSWFTGNPWLGVVAAVLASAAYSLILAIGSVALGGDPIVLSIAMNLLAVGLTSFLLRTVFGTTGSFSDPGLRGLDPVLFGHSPLVYAAWVAVAVLAFLLYRTTWGLKVRGIGENAEAAANLGVNVARERYRVIIAGGALCGLGGAQLALGNVTLFSENMTAGRGWIAVVAVMLGMAAPVGVLLAALLFGLAEGLGFRLQGLGLPQQATDAAPYVVTLLALFSQRLFRRERSTA
ncbi:ABC transporter permease [Amycolatopsis sp. YIM 10]|uniref:ABC transporter permease n=1 Tax=Amycolatopsis sp. YIM 10 TaxID=2653857 RepID=UPI0012907AF3|nr:ABC transporter permease [Amycolatopsis sp. YIM 10]QFU93727.1 Branched-chain amino acid transport system / permease component [Amycolatopsis sp. YIM 10]